MNSQMLDFNVQLYFNYINDVITVKMTTVMCVLKRNSNRKNRSTFLVIQFINFPFFSLGHF